MMTIEVDIKIEMVQLVIYVVLKIVLTVVVHGGVGDCSQGCFE